MQIKPLHSLKSNLKDTVTSLLNQFPFVILYLILIFFPLIMDTPISNNTTQFSYPEWINSFSNNIGIYVLLFIIGLCIINIIRTYPRPDDSDDSYYARFARFFVFGHVEVNYTKILQSSDNSPSGDHNIDFLPDDVHKDQIRYSGVKKAFLLCFSVSGLLGSYLLWGVLQERIVTRDYNGERFMSSNFLVFCNRFLALLVAYFMMRMSNQPQVRIPHYQYSFASLSNILSSWCQLEALKYLSFPTQVMVTSSHTPSLLRFHSPSLLINSL